MADDTRLAEIIARLKHAQDRYFSMTPNDALTAYRRDVPWLLGRLDKARAEAARLRAECEDLRAVLMRGGR